MEPDRPEPAPEELLTHTGWVRALAARLVADDATADDVAQDTWVAALRSPPGDPRSPQPWLRRVLVNFARKSRRGNARRERRERRAASEEELPSSADLVLRMETQRMLADAILTLEDPHRAAIVLRYYEGLSPSEIARRRGVPASTVRSHLKRGLERLRQELDRRHAGGREAWTAALLPWTRPVPAATSLIALGAGALIMKTAVMVGTVAGLGLLAAIAWQTLEPGAPVEPTRAVHGASVVTALDPPPDAGPSLASTRTEERSAVAVEKLPGPPATVADRTGFRIEVRIVDEDGYPLAGASLGTSHSHSQPSGSDGRVRLEFQQRYEESFSVGLTAGRAGYATKFFSAVVTRGETAWVGDVALEPGGSVAGRVTAADGQPVAGAEVQVIPADHLLFPGAYGLLTPLQGPAARTATDGRFLVDGVAAGARRVLAGAPDMLHVASESVEVVPGEIREDVDVVLEARERGLFLGGVVLSPTEEAVSDAMVSARREPREVGWTSTSSRSDREGRFRFEMMFAGPYEVRAEVKDGRWNDVVQMEVPHGTTDLVLRFEEEGRWIDVVVREPDDTPVADFTLQVEPLEQGGEWGPPGRQSSNPGFGRVREPDGPFRIRVDAPRHTRAELGPFEVGQAASPLLCVLEPLPGLRGRVLDGDDPVGGARVALHALVVPDELIVSNGFRTLLHARPVATATTDAGGRFLLTPREAARCALRVEQSGFAVAEVALGDIDPRVGQEDVEVRLGRGGVIEGRVVTPDESDPTGTVVGISRGDGSPRTKRVGPDGSYRFERLTPGRWEVRDVPRMIPPRMKGIDAQASGKLWPEPPWACEVFEGETTVYDLRLGAEEPCDVSGRFLLDGKGAVGWEAQLRAVESYEPVGARVGEDGLFRITAPRQGAYHLNLRPPDESPIGFWLWQVIALTPGPNPWSLELGTGRVEGSVPVPLGGKRVILTWRGPDGVSTSIQVHPDETGSFVLERVPAGRVELKRRETSRNSTSWVPVLDVDVPAGGTARADLP